MSRQRPRVVFLGHVARYSGAEIALVRLIDALDGVDATVILAEDGQLVRALEEAGARVEVLPMPERARAVSREESGSLRHLIGSALVTLRYCWSLRNRLQTLGADVVHTNSLKAGLYGSIAARLAGVPSVWHLHDRLASDYLPRTVAQTMRVLIAVLPTRVICTSEAVRETLSKWSRGGNRVVVIAPAVQPPPRIAPLRERIQRVGILGRITPWKGQDVFLRAFGQAFPDTDVRAAIVGAPTFGEEAFEAELESLVEELGLGDRVEMRGFRPSIFEEIERLDVVVHASRIPEPFGMVVVEAMAAGVPVIASAAGGPASLIEDGVDGSLVPPGDAPALARALGRMADRDGRERLRTSALRRARMFAPAGVAEQVQRLYSELLR